ncbi:MAG: DUF971 domain-containing protein [Acidimicrobiia bacterium]
MEIPARIEVQRGEKVIITWEDGTGSEFTARELRAGCECAGCRDPKGAEATARALADIRGVRIADARLVGDYAVNFTFEPDGHSTGIFSYDMLRAMGES